MRRSAWHDWRLELGVLLTLLAWGSTAPQTRAGCGESTVVIGPSAGTPHSVESASAPKTMPHSLPLHSMPGRRPCSGPHCSRAPLAPAAPPAITIVASQEWACLPILPNGTNPQGIVHRLEDDPRTPIFRTFRIYHPPR